MNEDVATPPTFSRYPQSSVMLKTSGFEVTKLHTAHPSAPSRSLPRFWASAPGKNTWRSAAGNCGFQNFSTGQNKSIWMHPTWFPNPCPLVWSSCQGFKAPRNPQFQWVGASRFVSAAPNPLRSVRADLGLALSWWLKQLFGNREPIDFRMKRLVFCKHVLSSNSNPSILWFQLPSLAYLEQMKPICKEWKYLTFREPELGRYSSGLEMCI